MQGSVARLGSDDNPPVMSSVRMIEACRQAGQAAAYHVLIPAGGASFEIRLDTDRDLTGVDSVTALLVGSTALDDLSEKLRSRVPLLTLGVPREHADARPRLAGRALVMSPAALLLAERVRQRRRRLVESERGHACYAAAAEDRACVNALLDELLRNFSNDSSAADVQRSTNRTALVNRARRLLAACPGSPHPLMGLAEALGISGFHLARIFRAETGLSVHQYLLRLRMAGALARLSCSETELSRLALDLGFSSHSHFTTTFRKQFGESPARVRRALERDRRPRAARPVRLPEIAQSIDGPVWNPYASFAAVIGGRATAERRR